MPQQQPPARAASHAPTRPRMTGTSLGMFSIVALIWLFSLVVVGAIGYGAGALIGGQQEKREPSWLIFFVVTGRATVARISYPLLSVR